MTMSGDYAKKLYDDVIRDYYANPNMTMGEILDIHLKKYNDAVAEEINKNIIELMGATLTSVFVSEAIPYTKAQLSKALYKNAQSAAKVTHQVMKEHIANKSAINEIREALYDGYGYDELLDIKKTLPKYLSKPLSESKVARLKTQALKNSYMAMLESINDKQFEKNMKVALEERARYFALRIARTEEAKAFTLANAVRQIDEGIKYVRWTLSSLHRTTCICEFYANQDLGYGKGVYKLMNAPAPVYSSHPNCLCSLRPVYREPKYKKVDKEEYKGKHKRDDVYVKDLFKK